jgi:hypothetical protein
MVWEALTNSKWRQDKRLGNLPWKAIGEKTYSVRIPLSDEYWNNAAGIFQSKCKERIRLQGKNIPQNLIDKKVEKYGEKLLRSIKVSK